MTKRREPVRNKRPAAAPQKKPPAQRWITVLFFPILILLCAGIYWHTTTYKTTGFDDETLMASFTGSNLTITDAFTGNALMVHKGTDFYRPLQSVTFMLDAASSKTSPFSYHRTNIIIHCLMVCSLLYLLLLLGYNRWLSLFMSFLFAATPLFANAVAWIPARGDLLLGFFVLGLRCAGLLPSHAAADQPS